MKCKSVTAENFRNIASASVCFDDGVNILFGQNAQGKTNLLEAIMFFSLGKSCRGAKEPEFIAFEQKTARLSLDFEDRVRPQNISIDFYRDRLRRVTQNGVKIARMSEIIGQFRAVLFLPEHLNVIKEGPAMRRNYLDVALSQLRPLYLRSLQRYNHILAQRNSLIKNARDDKRAFDATVGPWSAQLAHEAAFIIKSRLGYLDAVGRELDNCFSEMTGGRETPQAEYDFSFKISREDALDLHRAEEIYLSQLMSSHDREIAVGATLWGVHKDDVMLKLNGKSARLFASQGQQRSLALALKLAEGAICRADTGEEPVFLLDDVFSELDSERRGYLVSKLRCGQVIVSACGDTGFDDMADTRSVNIIDVSGGTYTRRGG